MHFTSCSINLAAKYAHNTEYMHTLLCYRELKSFKNTHTSW